MSIDDETWDKCYICGQTQTGNNYRMHGIGICTRAKRQASNLDKAVEAVQSSLEKADARPKKNLADIGFDNIMSVSAAIEAAGGNSIRVLKDFRELFSILSQNNISIKAEYHGPRKP